MVKFQIGNKVKVKKSNDNECYNSFKNKTLTIVHIDKLFDEEGNWLYSFKDENNEEIGNSLYEWEISLVKN